MTQDVEMFTMKSVRRLASWEGAYEPNRAHRRMWVRRLSQKIVERLLQMKLLVPAKEELVESRRVRIQRKLLYEKVWELRGDMLQRMNRPPSMILVGAVDYEEWVCEADSLTQVQTYINTEIPMGLDGEIHGVPMKIVPNMRGVVVLP